MLNRFWVFIGVSNKKGGFHQKVVNQTIQHDCDTGDAFMIDDFGYFGSGLEGYVQYNEAFKRYFDSISVPSNLTLVDKPNNNDTFENEDQCYDEDGEI